MFLLRLSPPFLPLSSFSSSHVFLHRFTHRHPSGRAGHPCSHTCSPICHSFLFHIFFFFLRRASFFFNSLSTCFPLSHLFNLTVTTLSGYFFILSLRLIASVKLLLSILLFRNSLSLSICLELGYIQFFTLFRNCPTVYSLSAFLDGEVAVDDYIDYPTSLLFFFQHFSSI